MTGLPRLPARARLTLSFAVAMAALFGGSGAGLYATMGNALLDELDTGLRARAATIAVDVADPGFRLVAPSPGLLERTEEFVQILAREGALIDSSPGVTEAVRPSGPLAAVTGPRFFQRTVPGIVGTARILVLPGRQGARPVFLVVGASMSDRADALHLMAIALGVGGPLAVLLASIVGWLLAGTALRPIERMRREASAISASGLDRRLSLPAANDEFRRLAGTLNEMLSRLDTAMQGERRFLDNASHELRTPLTALKAELDIAQLRPRAPEELLGALRSASEETDRLARMADDLLVLSRAHGRLPILRAGVALDELIGGSGRLFGRRAASAEVQICVAAPDTVVHLDRAQVRQAVDNLVDNALRHSPPGTTVRIEAAVADGSVRIVVDDEGPGFPSTVLDRAFEPFVRGPAPTAEGSTPEGTGLGLPIVRAVAEGHGGSVAIESRPGGGGRVILVLPGALSDTAQGSAI